MQRMQHPFRRVSDLDAVEEDLLDNRKEAVVDAFWATLAFAAATVVSLYLIGVVTSGEYPGQD